MYGTDGTKKHLQLLNKTNIIPPMPDSTNQQVILDYISNVSMFNNGKIGVLKNSTDNYIYTIYSTYNLLRVPKVNMLLTAILKKWRPEPTIKNEKKSKSLLRILWKTQ